MNNKDIKILEEKILFHKDLYYRGQPEISDEEFDKLELKLKSMNPDSYALKVVGSRNLSGKKVRHERKMLSLDKTYKVDDLKSWAADSELVAVYKVDGVSCSLVYENGILALAKTRGDGEYGEDITENCLWINSIAKSLEYSNKIEIRGELYCSFKNFQKLKEEMRRSGLDEPTSPRNITAGLLGRKDHVSLAKYLDFLAFDIDGINLKEESKKIELLEKLEFRVPGFNLIKADKIEEVIESYRNFIEEGNYQTDGIVFTFNDIETQNALGETSHHPKYRMAFKFQGDTAETAIKEIVWQVSRNGVLTPVAMVEPVEISGATIERVTLHNLGYVDRFMLKSGDTIEIVRSGEVIPKFLNKKKSSDNIFLIPENCPSCGNLLAKEDIRLVCNNQKCHGRNLEIILNFVAKANIYDLSSKRVEELMSNGFVSSIDDLYKITKEDLLSLPKTKDKLATRIYESIQSKKKLSLPVFFAAIGITGIGETKIQKIIDAGYDNVEKILRISLDELMAIESFAEKSSQEFILSIASKRELIQKLLDTGLEVIAEKRGVGVFSGKKFVITGTLSRPRSKIEKAIKECGGNVLNSVSKEINYLVTNEITSTSSKFKMAKKLEIPLLTEEELYLMMENSNG